MRIIVGADHGGFELKEKIKLWLLEQGNEVEDVGANSMVANDDYVDYAKLAVKKAVSKEDRVILFCRNGFGMSIVANRFAGVRCGVAFDEMAIAKGRTDDDLNCLSVPADYIEEERVKKMIEIFLSESFSNEEKYLRRITKIEADSV